MRKKEKRKSFLNKIQSWFLLVGAGIILTSCGKAKTETSFLPETENVFDQTKSEKTSNEQKTAYIPYAYEQEKNIIEDNYRNYYEIFVYSFYDSDSDGIGDLNGVCEKLDYIEEMGFNGIWLMPVFQSTTYHKYDVVDYMTIDAEYGTNEDFENLIAECHKRGIRVVLDFVINHTSSQNQWFIDAKSYLGSLQPGQEPDVEECKYVDYYHFSKEKVNDSYYKIGGTEWYYEGVFWDAMPDLNLSSPYVREELEQIADYWIELGVDGFRMDAAMHFEENDADYNTEVLNWLYEYCKEKNPEFYMVSEVWANKATIQKYYESNTPSMFNFDAAGAEGKIIKAARGNFNAEKFVNAMISYQEDFSSANPDFIDAPFITNHDMGRVSNSLNNDEDNLKFAGGLLLTMNGCPFIYYGEEIGMASKGSKDENKRVAMLWSNEDLTGMTKGPKDADSSIQSAFGSVEEQMEDPSSILKYYQRALSIRNENPEIARGKIERVEEFCKDDLAVITKTYEDSTIAIVYNTSDDKMTIHLNDTAIFGMNIRGYLTVDGSEVMLYEDSLTLPAKSITVLK